MLLFRSEGHVLRWCESRELTRGGSLTPEQAWRLARGWYARKLAPDWRRHTVEEAEQLLREVGLEGEFWRLRG
jgi:hypothetical protein